MRRRSFLKVMTWLGLSYGVLLAASMASACYKANSPNLPGCPKDAVWPDPCASNPAPIDAYEFCTVIGIEIDVDSGARDDAGVWHYTTHGTAYPCDAGKDVR